METGLNGQLDNFGTRFGGIDGRLDNIEMGLLDNMDARVAQLIAPMKAR